jgi:hypothetical protein
MKIKIAAIFLLIGGVSLSSAAAAQEERHEVRDLLTAENFVSAFYSFEPDKLRPHLANAGTSEPFISFYQGWAKGGNYIIANRQPCKISEPQKISCSITVIDDLVKALDIDFNVTDTFHLSFDSGNITSFNLTTDDPPIYLEAHDWVVENRAELFNDACSGFFEGGPTPEECVRSMLQGYKDFKAHIDAINE